MLPHVSVVSAAMTIIIILRLLHTAALSLSLLFSPQLPLQLLLLLPLQLAPVLAGTASDR
jgi:hypothetical protein